MLTRLPIHISRKLLNTTIGFQKVTKCQFSRLALNLNVEFGSLRKNLIFNAHKHSKVYGIYLVRYESTDNTAGKETVSTTSPVSTVPQTEKLVDIDNKISQVDLISEIPDPPLPLTEEIVQTIKVHANGEPTFESLGLGGYSPVGLLQSYYEWFHITCDLPWWAVVVITAVIIKVVTFPFTVKVQRNSAKMQHILPPLVKIQEKLSDARGCGNTHEASIYAYQLQNLLKDNKVSIFPMSNIGRFAVHIPVFIALRGMANESVESLKEGGLWWFKDLTATDPYFILPLSSAILMYAVAEHTLRSPGNTSNINPAALYLIRGIPIISFLFATQFPGIVLCHWTVSNIITILQNEIMKLDKVKIFLNIPLPIVHPKIYQPDSKKKSFKQAFSESWSNLKVSNKLASQARADMIQFNKAGKGPLQKTFKYNPMEDLSKTVTSISAMKK